MSLPGLTTGSGACGLDRDGAGPMARHLAHSNKMINSKKQEYPDRHNRPGPEIRRTNSLSLPETEEFPDLRLSVLKPLANWTS